MYEKADRITCSSTMWRSSIFSSQKQFETRLRRSPFSRASNRVRSTHKAPVDLKKTSVLGDVRVKNMIGDVIPQKSTLPEACSELKNPYEFPYHRNDAVR